MLTAQEGIAQCLFPVVFGIPLYPGHLQLLRVLFLSVCWQLYAVAIGREVVGCGFSLLSGVFALLRDGTTQCISGINLPAADIAAVALDMN